ncbi:hypothetical protein ASPWEDRAFT_34510 [Aspergillus wentii DTO 134E9]|uniref:Glutathione S-transferase kappa n=1 Tax=Aspergillus wentii DTO 134E9 TaxID=1073089 RepID=A0A1L9S1K0_ASPWE|nr:uncharacterized protein ASPWEDRAFT_34510 [Aspergillus wentii DTO 134E9]KAI9930973.1 hypothetical protein MW887_010628 [Aspergillus wentii]OJJ41034.1 hypothetical protein ASPWEDRAFT_34510 [Aspergillus wentii DTO 134E9]
MAKITLYFDIVSPFAYLAFHVLRKSPVFAQCEISYVPIFLGGLMNACGNTPPIKIKNKDAWLNQERDRWARYFDVPMIKHFPEDFPPMTLEAQRALCAINQRIPEKLLGVTEELYRSIWIHGNMKVGQGAALAAVLERVLGKNDADAIIKATKEPEIKALVASNTDRAFKDGAFGLPWFECTNAQGKTEGFWGIDHLGQVVDFLGLQRRLDNGFRALL